MEGQTHPDLVGSGASGSGFRFCLFSGLFIFMGLLEPIEACHIQ